MHACSGPLAGLFVIEVDDGIPAMYAAKLLAQAGAHVVRIDTPLARADAAGTAAPFAAGPSELERALHDYLNLGKESAAINLDLDDSRRLLRELLGAADVLITSLSATGLRQRSLAIPALLAARPALVITTITPWGAEGPLAELGGSDLLLFHAGGLGAITPRFANNPGDPPLRLGAPLAEYLSGLTAAVATLHATSLVREGGAGQHVDVSGQQAIAFATGFYATFPSYEHRAVSRVSRPELAPYHFLPCRDGWVMLICPEERQWRAFVELMGNPEWAESPVFATVPLRSLNWDALGPLITEWTVQRGRDDLYKEAQAARIPLAAVYTVDALLGSEQLQAREFFQTFSLGQRELRLPGTPARSSHGDLRASTEPPRHGAATESVLTEWLGLRQREIAALRAAGVI